MNLRSAAHKRNGGQKEADRKLVANLRARSTPFHEIVVAINDPARGVGYTLSKTQVFADWQHVKQDWREEARADVEGMVLRELAGMQAAEAELWKAWHGSKMEGTQCGSPRYLSQLNALRSARIKLLGLRRLKTAEPGDKPGLTPESLAQIEQAAALI